MSNYVIRTSAADNNIRGFFAVTTEMVEKARTIHEASPVATAALGRVITAASIMGLMMKGDKDKLTLQVMGGGPAGSVVAVSNSKGMVKGYISNPSVDVPLKEDGKLDVGGAVGIDGKISVMRDLGMKEPYIGQNDLFNGEIAQDLTHYYAYSEQQPSAVSLGVLIEKDSSVKAAGGFIVQLMPDADEEIVSRLEQNLVSMKNITALIEDGNMPEDIMNMVFDGLSPKVLQKDEVDFECDCSREKFEKALVTIGEEDFDKLINEDNGAELVCHFCNSKYNFTREDLEELKKNM
ncbi:molecular chaperone Hsp33 [Peptoclostridium litorale DSM 5388]|uniref:33 kDa chaperonin n=1 Tax=Peptoclostridium litorale DSM 5388 TaxID=1121324 RepID=A0A069RE59_PEPLI|nr:Hsp33 family molecular chaperone HslO [Peptoclostridium litorale]KDR93889.1 33 kDa chaperonin [Peptoclostridium litorale DSM 5388]KDR95316.1 33 kDa chaperonin [Peptoclostridium litorale DSM 5388]SIN87950.1 molecular chaperone Hsp33 [Peptoclostridium litorale DSM 5388]